MEVIASSIQILIDYHQAFFNGLMVTLKLASIIWGGGVFIGGALGWASAAYPKLIGLPCRIISFILSSIPVLVFLFWLHYPAQAIWNLVIDPFYTSALTFTVLNIFGVAELFRTQIIDFPRQYLVAAKVCGLPRKTIAIKIELPIILRQVLPSLLMLQVTMLHITLFASLISVDELFRAAQRINASIYKPVEIYTALALFFLAISLPLNALAIWMKNVFTRNLSEN